MTPSCLLILPPLTPSCLPEFNAPGGTSIGSLTRSYTWGLDIVHSLTSAGGVGALLQVVDHASGMSYLPTYDANGNIASLLDADTGSAAAIYEYSPFGELVRCEGSYAKQNPFRFSTKFTDDETTLVYYGRRHYSPSQGRFLGRDPVEEAGGLNLYGFVGNNPVNRWDYLGMNPSGAEYHSYASEWWVIDSPGAGYGTWGHGTFGWGYYNDPVDMFSPSLLGPEDVNPHGWSNFGPSSVAPPSDEGGGGTVSDANSASQNECSGDAGAAAVATAPQPTSNPPAPEMGAPAGTSSTPDPTKNGIVIVAALATTASRTMPLLVSTGVLASAMTGAGVGALGYGAYMAGTWLDNRYGISTAIANWVVGPVYPAQVDNTRTPSAGAPGSVIAFPDGTTRVYGPDGRAVTDIDRGHDHGAGDPHSHDWNWSKPNPRQPGRPCTPEETGISPTNPPPTP